jgi:NADPH-dependent 2,4-dienoyl-CoA reductase/sulfur reductase-like enzyme
MIPGPSGSEQASARPTVVIVSAGFGRLRAARALRHLRVDVVLIDRHNYHLFQPLLYQVAIAGLEPCAGQIIGFRNKIFVVLNWAWDYLFYERASRLITDE